MSRRAWSVRVLPLLGGLGLVAAVALTSSENHTGAAGSYKVTVPLVARDAPAPVTVGATAVATITATPAPTTIPTPAGISVRKTSSYVSSTGTLHIVGEVVNGLSSAAQYVEITADLYSATGTLLATDFTFSQLSIIPSGGSSPFDLLVLSPPSGVSRYQVRITDYVSPPYGGKIPVTGLSGNVTNVYTSSTGTVHFVGTVTNNSGRTYKYVEPIIALYGPDGNVIRVDFTFTKPDTLATGQSGTFDLLVFDGNKFTFRDYSLWVDGTD